MMDDATPKPRMVAIELTRRCNLRCAHCRALSSALCAADELSRGELDGIFKDVASFAASSVCILTGGEPLLREDLAEIAASAVEKGLKPAVGTNGTLLTPAAAKALFSSGVRNVSVSIDFPTEREHDAFRGVEGAFKAAIAGVANAIDAGIDVQINTSITKRNRALVPEIHDLAVRLGAKAFHPFILVQHADVRKRHGGSFRCGKRGDSAARMRDGENVAAFPQADRCAAIQAHRNRVRHRARGGASVSRLPCRNGVRFHWKQWRCEAVRFLRHLPWQCPQCRFRQNLAGRSRP